VTKKAFEELARSDTDWELGYVMSFIRVVGVCLRSVYKNRKFRSWNLISVALNKIVSFNGRRGMCILGVAPNEISVHCIGHALFRACGTFS
jgi:hypothetical protein